jgi:hypothetical protein
MDPVTGVRQVSVKFWLCLSILQKVQYCETFNLRDIYHFHNITLDELKKSSKFSKYGLPLFFQSLFV